MLITCYYINQDFFGYLLAFISGTVRFQGNLLCPSYSPGRSSDWLTSVLANDRGWGPGQGAVAESLFGICLSSEHRNTVWTGAELQWQAWVKGKCCWQQQLGLSLCFPWQLCRSMCSWSPVAPQCTTGWDVYCSPEQLRSRGAKDINKKDKSRTWTQMSDHTHS